MLICLILIGFIIQNMIFFKILIVIAIVSTLSACGPMALVGAVGQTVNNAAYNSAERELNKPYSKSRDEQALEVATANMNLGIEYMKQGAYENALTRLQRSILAKPDFAPSYNVLGLLYQRLGDPDEAEKNFKESISLEPNSSSTKNNYGLFLCANKRIAEAEKSFQEAANNPLYNAPEIALTNAGLCILNDRPAEAETYFKKALTKNPNFSYALIQMVDISYNRRNYELAHDYFERYQNVSRHTPKSLWLGIRISSELGYKDSVSSYALLLRNQYPDTEEARQLKEWSF